MKYRWEDKDTMRVWSHPARGAWIEIPSFYYSTFYLLLSHPARGAWIEIIEKAAVEDVGAGRTPHGVRGLKFPVPAARPAALHVAPRTGCVD